MFEIKQLTTIEEMKAVQVIEEKVWDTEPTPVHQTYTASKNGGLVIGGYKDGELVAFQYSFPGFKNGESYLCSHMLGILPAYQRSGLGKKMKEYQRLLAREMGYSLIVWTFDPLESVNAYLNLHKLKAIAGTYLENHYGMMNDALNQGLPTDRFLVEWWMESEHVNKERTGIVISTEHAIAKTKRNEKGFPIIEEMKQVNQNNPFILVPIPENFQEMKKTEPELTMEWRYNTRVWFKELIEQGYVAEDIIRNPEQSISYYLFRKRYTLALGH